MIRVVLDTNVLVSALLQPLGPSPHLLLLALNGSIQLCITGSIYAEYEEVISRPRFRRSAEVITVKALLIASLDAFGKRRGNMAVAHVFANRLDWLHSVILKAVLSLL